MADTHKTEKRAEFLFAEAPCDRFFKILLSKGVSWQSDRANLWRKNARSALLRASLRRKEGILKHPF
jgi:hypothetical protein